MPDSGPIFLTIRIWSRNREDGLGVSELAEDPEPLEHVDGRLDEDAVVGGQVEGAVEVVDMHAGLDPQPVQAVDVFLKCDRRGQGRRLIDPLGPGGDGKEGKQPRSEPCSFHRLTYT